jgi:hypothetical protein
MPITDSIKILADTLSSQSTVVRTDTGKFFLSDTALNIGSLQKFNTGFEGLLKPSTPQNESWVFITLLLLLIILAYSFLSSSGWLKESVHSFFRVKERSSIFNKTTVKDFESQFFLIVFSTVVISLHINIFLEQKFIEFSFIVFTKFLAMSSGFILIKYLLIQITGNVFTNAQKLKIARESYFNIYIYTGILLYPILIFKIYSNEIPLEVINFIIFAIMTFAGFLLIIKLFQIFFENIVDSFYLLLYLCTLEILPFFLLYKGYILIK